MNLAWKIFPHGLYQRLLTTQLYDKHKVHLPLPRTCKRRHIFIEVHGMNLTCLKNRPIPIKDLDWNSLQHISFSYFLGTRFIKIKINKKQRNFLHHSNTPATLTVSFIKLGPARFLTQVTPPYELTLEKLP